MHRDSVDFRDTRRHLRRHHAYMESRFRHYGAQAGLVVLHRDDCFVR